MNDRMLLEEREEPVEFLVAIFGKGRLVQTVGGRYELRGGTLSDLLEAREWASLFMPEAIVRSPAGRRRCST
jgi:hypothetical protein